MEHLAEGGHTLHTVHHFHHMLRIERKRTERSRKPFLLMLLDISGMHAGKRNGYVYEKIKPIIDSCARETDIKGWYEHNKTIGTIFTEMVAVDNSSVERIFHKLNNRIGETLDAEDIKKIKISFHAFPAGNGNSAMDNGLFNVALYPKLSKSNLSRQATSSTKKLMDMTRSFFALLVFSIILLIIAAIKLTS